MVVKIASFFLFFLLLSCSVLFCLVLSCSLLFFGFLFCLVLSRSVLFCLVVLSCRFWEGEFLFFSNEKDDRILCFGPISFIASGSFLCWCPLLFGCTHSPPLLIRDSACVGCLFVCLFPSFCFCFYVLDPSCRNIFQHYPVF